MDFLLTSEQTALADSVRRFCEENGTVRDRRGNDDETSNGKLWRAIAELGWLGAGLSEAEGGFGGGPVESALIAEAFGRSLIVEPYLSTAVLATRTLLASEGDHSALLEGAISGSKTLALACLEPDGRGDPAHVSLRAETVKGGYLLSGHKCLVLDGAGADILLVTARVAGERDDHDGVALFRVDPNHPSLRKQAYRLVDRRPACDLWLDGVEVTADAVIGEPARAMDAVKCGVDHAMVSVCADSLGAVEAALWLTRDYLKIRKQFGQTLNTFQALQHRMADMLVEMELARSMLFAALSALALDGDARSRTVSAAKATIGRAGIFIGQQAIQLHGGVGMTEEYAVGRYYKRLLVNASLFGSIDHHVERFAALSSGAPASAVG